MRIFITDTEADPPVTFILNIQEGPTHVGDRRYYVALHHPDESKPRKLGDPTTIAEARKLRKKYAALALEALFWHEFPAPAGEKLDHVDAAIRRTSWPMLREQKRALIQILNDHAMTPERQEHLDGILNWIDALQDAAANDGLPVKFLDEPG